MNDRAAARESDIINTVFSLLRLYPREADVDRRMVITIAPALWWSRLAVISAPSDAEGAGGSWKILDVSPLVGAAEVSGLVEPDLETHMVRRFVQAGWPRDAIVAHYRENLRSDFTADLALLDGEGTCQVAIELVSGGRRPDSDLPATIRKLRERTSAMWFCVTDGVNFHLFDRETGGHRTVHQAFAPREVGVHVPQDSGAADLPEALASFGRLPRAGGCPGFYGRKGSPPSFPSPQTADM